jgi:hypothetical protein
MDSLDDTAECRERERERERERPGLPCEAVPNHVCKHEFSKGKIQMEGEILQFQQML